MLPYVGAIILMKKTIVCYFQPQSIYLFLFILYWGMSGHEISMSLYSILVRCLDCCSCYHPTCLLTYSWAVTLEGGRGRVSARGWGWILSPDTVYTGSAQVPDMAPVTTRAALLRSASNNQHNEDSFPRSPLLTGIPYFFKIMIFN